MSGGNAFLNGCDEVVQFTKVGGRTSISVIPYAMPEQQAPIR
jgi:hypothetical protein